METPLAIVRSSRRAMIRLDAEESLEAVTRTAAGSGRLEADDSKALMRMWQKAAELEPRPVVRQRDPEALAAIGIGVTPSEAPAHE